jgi:uncharacterized protein YjbI with pentapeptide repeats
MPPTSRDLPAARIAEAFHTYDWTTPNPGPTLPSDGRMRVYRALAYGELKEILARHEKWVETEGDEGERARLTRVDLSDADLRFADLSDANLRFADLSDANLWDADLSDANLRKADLSDADLRKADLSDAYLPDADLSDANLWDADLSDANLWDADLSDANLRNADLSDADLRNADLSDADLRNADLSDADLRNADLSDADLRYANLSDAILAYADLSNARVEAARLPLAMLHNTTLKGAAFEAANLRSADVTGATFTEANLRNASLIGASGLQVQALARANCSNATLPPDVAEFDGLKTVESASKNARKLFIALGLACAYAALAISTESEGSLTLPFINVSISPWGFYHVVPVLLALGVGYFHLQLQRVWEEIARLPAIFPDGKAIDQKIDPWLVTGLARAHLPYVREEEGGQAGRVAGFALQQFVVITLVWGLVPLTQFYFLWSYHQADAVTYSALSSAAGTALLGLTAGGALVSYRTMRRTLRGLDAPAWWATALAFVLPLLAAMGAFFIG